MADKKNISVDISTLNTSDVVKIGSLKNRNVYARINGAGFINEDSTWDFVQSNDNGTTWDGVVGSGTFTGENSTNSLSFTNDGLILGLRLANKATETDGILNIDISAKG